MKLIDEWNTWANNHTNIATDALRISLGVFLFAKGVFFMNDTQALLQLMSPFNDFGWSMIVVHYVAMAHLAGGLLITFGLLTRLAVLINLPILLGALLINFIGDMNVFNLIQATLALGLSCFYEFFGSGKHSVDYRLKMHV